ncbi:MAG TPA: DUF3343 domain-containing protein [Firmicutes bacterium]|nr:DUF3343 domain-containing protein [Bacillota bacterium]
MEYIATFYTQSGAIKYQRYLQKENIPVELLPVPRQISSNCGIGARFTLTGDVADYISEDLEKLFEITPQGYGLIYANE